MPRLTIKFLSIFISLMPLPLEATDIPLFAVASSVQAALEDIARQFHRDTGTVVRLSFGSSGNFYRQIVQGAPFEIFFSADEAFVNQLIQAGHTVDQGVLYASGRLVLFAPKGSTLKVDEQATDLKAALEEERVRRFAIANPEHAPYGQAAKQVLQALGLWTLIEDKLVLGENVAQAAQFALSGSAQGGIFAYSLALSPQISALGRFIVLPEHLHQPLRQRAVLLNKASATAREFYQYVQQADARAAFQRYGFTVPGQ